MDFIDKVTEKVSEKSKAVTQKAKELAEIAKLKNEIHTCREILQKNYLEIGKMVYQEYSDSKEAAAGEDEHAAGESEEKYLKQLKAIENARHAITEIEKQMDEAKRKLQS